MFFIKQVKPRYMREDKQAQMMNNFHLYGVKARALTPEAARSDTQPSYGELLCLSLNDILPSTDDQRKLLDNYCVLFARVICEHIPFFRKFEKCVPSHINHPYTQQMSQKSEVVSVLLPSKCLCIISVTFNMDLPQHTFRHSQSSAMDTLNNKSPFEISYFSA